MAKDDHKIQIKIVDEIIHPHMLNMITALKISEIDPEIAFGRLVVSTMHLAIENMVAANPSLMDKLTSTNFKDEFLEIIGEQLNKAVEKHFPDIHGDVVENSE